MESRSLKKHCASLLCALITVYWVIQPARAQGTCTSPSSRVTTNNQLQAIFATNPGCTILQGDLNIGYADCLFPCQISSLTLLSNVQSIQGSLSISCCPLLTGLDGLNSLVSVESFGIYFNQNLTGINGFQSLANVNGNVKISQNPKLQTVTGFSSLSSISGYLEIERNVALLNFNGLTSLTTVRGNMLTSGHALNIVYNTALTDLAGLRALVTISYGTVRIEGNIALCYAGYPQWGDSAFVARTGSEVEDKGIDWRSLFSERNMWQYTFGVEGGGYPTLLIQNNAPSGTCGSATCDATCLQGAGCLSPNSASACGSCTVVGGINPCDLPTAPPPPSSLGTILGVVLTIVAVIGLVLLALGIWGCVVVGKRYHELRQGSFDISVKSVEDGVELRSNSRSTRYTNARAADQIATIAEPTTGGSNVTRKGVKSKPKLDSIVVSSYRQATDSPSLGNPTPDSYKPKGQRSSSKGEHPMTAKRAPNSLSSRPKSESDILTKRRRSSNLEVSGREPSTEDILARLREEQAEIPMDFPWDQIKVGKEFGSGDFGKVYHAEAKKLLPGQKKTTIMVKQLKEGATKEEKELFLRPVEAMKLLQHPNVLQLLGVSMKGPSLAVMLEYCSQGNFKTFLVRKRRESGVFKQNNQLVSMACDMAAGLDYLHSMNIAHNDFAARSCLVTSEGKVKLGDYGITRQTFKEDYYARKPNQKALPIRWMAPELIVVQGRNILDSLPVSMPGNIWSFGVSLWEVCSFAQWPYDELSNEEVLQTLKTTGKCILENPLQPNDHIAPLFDICQTCWQSAELRPSMSDIHKQLQELKNSTPTRRRSSNAPPPRRISQEGRLASEGRPKSRSMIQTSIPREEVRNDDKRRTISSQPYKPKRPAPKKPPTSTSTFPRTRGRLDSAEEPLVISNPASIPDSNGESPIVKNNAVEQKTKKKDLLRKKTGSTEALLASTGSLSLPDERGFSESPPTAKTTPSYKQDRPKERSKSKSSKQDRKSEHKPKIKSSETGSNGLYSSAVAMDLSLPDDHDSELPLPQDMDQAVHEEQVMTEDDFILDPPQRFSQSSLDDIQGGGLVGVASGGGVSFNFDPMDEPDMPDDFYDEDTSDAQTIGASSYGTSRYDPPPMDYSNESPPLDRREPKMKEKIKSKQSGDSKISKRKKTPASFAEQLGDSEDLAISNPMWDDDENQFGQFENQFDEFDRRNAMEEDELPNVVYDEDVAALIW